jgi:Zn-finger nucleic acid-binding protein
VWVKLVDEKALMRMTPQVFTIDELRRLRKLYTPLGHDDPVHLRACPVCKALMYRRTWGGHSGVIVDRCEQHGTWYDTGEVEKVREYIREEAGTHFDPEVAETFLRMVGAETR